MSDTNWLTWDFVDTAGENPLHVPATFECEITFNYRPAADTTTVIDSQNIDDVIELTRVKCLHISTDADDRPPTADEKALIEPWVTEVVAQARQLQFQIKTAALQVMTLL